MHLAELLTLRGTPAAAVYLTITRRCPLHCAHCSTNSSLASEHYGGAAFLRFVETMTPESHPHVILITGGEPLLYPRLIRGLADAGHRAGSKIQVISGMFFVKGRSSIPPPILDALEGVDLFTASFDHFHEQEVPRENLIAALRELSDRGIDVSLQLTGMPEDGGYVDGLVADFREAFADTVPMLVTEVAPIGRGRDLIAAQSTVDYEPAVAPCSMAAWPVVSYDGSVIACCNQSAVDGGASDHLRLGHIASDDWSTIYTRCLASPLLRAIRLWGPRWTAKHQLGRTPESGYCETCLALRTNSPTAAALDAVLGRESTKLIEAQVELLGRAAGPVALARRFGNPRYAELTELGYTEQRAEAAVEA